MLPLLPHRSSQLIERPRLHETLQGVFTQPVTVLKAPAGYGKTTAIAQFAERTHQVRVVWHTVDPRQRDLYTLFMAAQQAISRTYPHLDIKQPAPNARPGVLAKAIVRFLRQQQEVILYVLDDAHLLDGAPLAEEWLEALALALPKTLVHLIIASHTVPSAITAKVIANGVLAIDETMLRFDDRETENLARTLNNGGTASEEAHRIAARMEGWPAGLAATFQPRASVLVEASIAPLAPEERFFHLVRTTFDAETPAMQRFLFQAAVPDVMEPEVLIQALKIPGAIGLMDEAMKSGLFLTRAPEGMVLHGLFREFLHREYRARDPQGWHGTHLRLARWYEERIAIDQAIESYLAGEATEEALRLIALYARTTFDQGRYEALFGWKTSLTEHKLVSAWLSYLCGAVLVQRRRYDEAAAALTEAWDAFAAGDDTDGMARVRLMHAHSLMLQGNSGDAVAIGREVAALGEALSKEVQAGAMRVIGRGLLYDGAAAEALIWLEAARPLYEVYCDRVAYAKLLNDLDSAYRQLGQADKAAEALEQQVAIQREMPGQFGLAEALNQFGSFLYQRGDLMIAQAQLREGLDRAIDSEDVRAEGYLYASLADIERDRGAHQAAHSYYQQAMALAGTDEPFLRSMGLIGLGTMMRWQGDLDQANQMIDAATYTWNDAAQTLHEAEVLADNYKYAIDKALAVIGQYALVPFRATSQEALAQIAFAQSTLDSRRATQELAFAHAVRARIYHLINAPAEVEAELAALLRLMETQPLIQAAIAEIHASPTLLAAVHNLPRRFAPLQNRLRKLQQMQVRPANIIPMAAVLPTPLLSHTLVVETLGAERYRLNGTTVLHNEWEAASARYMFVSLLVEGPQRWEPLAAKIFPTQEDAKKLNSNFHATLRRIRKLLGDDAVQKVDDLYHINPAMRISCDALLFEEAIRNARAVSDNDPTAIQLWLTAVNKYDGDFLPDCYDDWAGEYRARLERLYLDGVEKLGDLYQKRGDLHSAMAQYQTVLRREYFREYLHRQVMTLMGSIGQRARIKPHFNEMQREWQHHLGQLPSPETYELVKNLLN